MKQLCIRKGTVVRVKDGSLLHSVTLESGDRRRRVFGSALRWAAINPRLSEVVWFCHRGRKLISMTPARGERPHPMERLLLLSPLAEGAARPESANRALTAHGYGEDVKSLGHSSYFFFYSEGAPGAALSFSEETLGYLREDIERELRALIAVGAEEFARNLADAYALFSDKCAAGELKTRAADCFQPFDERFASLRPTLDELLDEYVSAHEREIFSALPEAEVVP